ncbi:MAG TPA: hypothetical protein VFX58_01115, partial [Chitinophagaceae bacterium]|nr:hypothetical protein [Chitinophagaceae bacterium]
MKDIKSLLLLLLSAGLISTWVYHLYDKTMYSQRRTEIYIKDSAAVADGIRDSLHKIYSTTIYQLDNQLDSTASSTDSLKTELNTRLSQIRHLQQEINGILGKKGATREELTLARKKISELQQIVDELRNQNSSMEEEQKKLNAVMAQLNGDIRGLQQNIQKIEEENKALTEKINLASVFVASELKLAAVTQRNARDEETNQVKKAEKFVVSFLLQNYVNTYNNAEVFIIVTGPDGEVLQNPIWESR